jgi:hypothetical protein
MAWTNPKTWTVGETLTAANFNTHIRDNLNAVGPHLIIRKSSDESVTSNTTEQADDALVLPVTANEIYQVQIGLLWTAGAGNLKVGFTFPASGTINFSTDAHDVGGTFEKKIWQGSSSPTTSADFLFQGSGNNFHLISGVFITAGTGGNLTLQWAQNSSSGTATTVKANSTLWAAKLA